MSATRVSSSTTPFSADVVRQTLNVVFAVGQVLTTLLTALNGTSGAYADNTPTNTTPIVPAGYVFSVWGLIYAGGLAYAIYQALPAQREQPLLRKIGWYTAVGYLGTSLWLITATHNWYWVTVGMFAIILVGILGALIGIIQYHLPFTRAERYLVVLPISVYAGWGSIAFVANISTALQASGVMHPLLPNAAWAIIMLVVTGMIATFVTIISRGNVSYALTVTWALIGIVVANVTRNVLPSVAITAGIVALLIVGSLLYASRRDKTPDHVSQTR